MTQPCLRRLAPIVPALLLLAGCARGSAPTPTPPPSTGMTTIRITVLKDAPNTSLDLLISAYQDRRPNIRVEKVPVTAMAGDEGIKALEPLVFEGKVDLFDASVLLGYWDRLGKQPAVDLIPYAQKSRFDAGSYALVRDELYKDGRLLSLPVVVQPILFVANDELVSAAGVTMPEGAWTWDQFRETALKLTHGKGDEKVWGFHAGRRTELLATAWVTEALQPQVGKADVEAARDWVRFLDGLVQDGAMPLNDKDIAAPGPSHFERRRAAITLMSLSPLFAPRPEWKVLPTPSHPGARPITPVALNSYAIPEASPNKEAAWDMLSFMAGPEGALVVAGAGYVPYQLTPEAKAAFLKARPNLPAGMAAALDSAWATSPSFADRTTRAGILWEVTFKTLTGYGWEGAASIYETESSKLK